LEPGMPLGDASYPLLAACDEASYQRFLPWGEALLQ